MTVFEFNGHRTVRVRRGECACRQGIEPGLSARAILTGQGCTPADPSDLCRCLEVSPEPPEHMRKVSPQWAALVDHWHELAALLVEEHPTGSGPKTYARMQQLAREARMEAPR